jgi:catechol 2,3-dioxygenase-like lactoylglutathione lyase family enzyme
MKLRLHEPGRGGKLDAPNGETVMPLKTLVGLDHVVVVVRDLDASARAWAALGFTVSPRGTHSAHMGTGNYTIMLGDDYIELLGVLTPTERNAPTRQLLEKREGIERVAFTTVDAAAGVKELQARGIAATGPIDFSRPVDLPDGRKSEARFQTCLWPTDERPGGVRIFACQHFTRDAVWIPHLQRHANAARRLVRLELIAADPKSAANHMARLIDQTVQAEPDGAWRVPSGPGRADFVFMGRAAFEARHPTISAAAMPTDGPAALVIEVSDLSAAAKATAAAGISGDSRITVPAPKANGITLVFTGAATT